MISLASLAAAGSWGETRAVAPDALGAAPAASAHAVPDMLGYEHLPAGPQAFPHGALGVRLCLLLEPTRQPEQVCAARNRAVGSARQMCPAGAAALARVELAKHRVLLRRPVARSARLHCGSAERLWHLPIERLPVPRFNPAARRLDFRPDQAHHPLGAQNTARGGTRPDSAGFVCPLRRGCGEIRPGDRHE